MGVKSAEFSGFVVCIGQCIQWTPFKALDPYHVVIGASDCADNYIFSDVPSLPVEPTATLSDAIIGFGQQPHTQLSLDYVMIENYGGGLPGHRNGGTWSTGVGNDGRLRNGIPFEPLCNCPGFGSSWQTVTDCGAGETILFSEMWEGVITAVTFPVNTWIL